MTVQETVEVSTTDVSRLPLNEKSPTSQTSGCFPTGSEYWYMLVSIPATDFPISDMLAVEFTTAGLKVSSAFSTLI